MTPWVRRLIVANIVVFGLQSFIPGVTDQLVLVPGLLLYRPWTLFTYMFAHGSLTHIAFNLYTFYIFGPPVEARLGSKNFIALYLLAGLGGGLLSFITPRVAILGASGAIMGVLVAFAVYWPREQILLFFVLPVEAWLLVTGYILVDLVGFGVNVAHFAHLGGAATGYLYLKVRDYRSPARAFKKRASKARVAGSIGNGDPLKRWRDIRLDDLHPINRDEVVRLLKKAQQYGTRSLTNEERATLDRFAGTA
jgi:membrane associated rhomboid family serine protease